MQTSPCPNCNTLLPPGTHCPKDGGLAPAPKEFGPGSSIKDYIVEKKIGEGGMGEVWLARHATIKKRVAIKVLTDKALSNAITVERFKREAMAVNEIRNKNIVDIFDFGELLGGRPYFIMEYLEGQSLSAYLSEVGILPFSMILHLFQQICKGLQAAHKKGIVHRDLKPDNIFLVYDEDLPTVKILDFGIAKVSQEEGQESLTKTNTIFGTPAYMSPEQCEGAKKVDHRSDIYSLGIILFRMITGRTPFQEPGDGSGAVFAKHLTMPAPAVSLFAKSRSISPAVDAFLLQVLSKDPNQRPDNPQLFYQSLVSAVGSQKDESFAEIQKSSFQSIKQEKHLTLKTIQTPQPITKTSDFFASRANTNAKINAKIEDQDKKKKTIVRIAAGGFTLLIAGICFLWIGQGTNTQQTTPTPKAPTASISLSPPSIPASTPTSKEVVPQKPEFVQMSIAITPKNARVLYNGSLIKDITPADENFDADIPYDEKEITITVQKSGYDDAVFSFVPNQNTSKTIKLTKKIAPAGSSNSKLPF